jgi:cytochrome P450
MATEAAGDGPSAFDPYEPGFAEWPYDQYRRLREQGPVQWSELLCGWIVTGHAEVTHVLRDGAVSSSLDQAKPSAVVDLMRTRVRNRPGGGLTLVLQDDPEHARTRRALQAPFTARRIAALRQSVETRVRGAIDARAGQREIELVADVAYPLPVAVFCAMFGIPDEAGPRFRGWTAAVAQSLDLVISEEDHDRCLGQIAEMEAYLTEVAAEKRRHPADDVLTELVHTEVDGAPLTPEELVAQLVTLYVAGHEPTAALIGNGMAALLAHPEQLRHLQEHPEHIPAAVQELLRYDGPNQFVRRTALEPLVLGDRQVDAGDVLYVGVGAANHDPVRWGEDADELRIDRPDAAQHVQFGGGVHHCLGAPLARLQAEAAFDALLTRCGALVPAGPVVWSGRMTLRSAARVPLALNGT